jgi:hypothetical protein
MSRRKLGKCNSKNVGVFCCEVNLHTRLEVLRELHVRTQHVRTNKRTACSDAHSPLASSQSFRFPSGNMTHVMFERLAAIIFSRIPPTGNTFPVKEISPVMARSGRTNLREKKTQGI